MAVAERPKSMLSTDASSAKDDYDEDDDDHSQVGRS